VLLIKTGLLFPLKIVGKRDWKELSVYQNVDSYYCGLLRNGTESWKEKKILTVKGYKNDHFINIF